MAADVLDLSDCLCIVCGGNWLEQTAPVELSAIQPGMLACGYCAARFDVIFGVPYLLRLEQRDFVALVEIAGEFDSSNYLVERARPLDDFWPKLLAARHAAGSAEAFEKDRPAHIASVAVEDRYEQWCEIELLSGGMDLTGANILVVGAGLGFDANLLLHRGAKVTAIDLNPQTNAFGRAQTPTARWIGALGRRLPFSDGAFDHVFISASLHHVLDVSATIVEMLRVLRPGGVLITTNDSYSADSTTDLEDARKWNDHVAVLRGINENTPRLKVFIDPLLARQDELDIEFWTSRVYGAPLEGQAARVNIMAPRRWDLAREHEGLRTTAGGLFMRIRKSEPIAEAHALAALIGNKRGAMARIARLTPDVFVSPPFPGPAGNTKFQVLNGWRWSEPGESGREAYLLGRWFMRRAADQNTLLVAAAAPKLEDAGPVSFEVAIDGQVVFRGAGERGQDHQFVVDASAAPADTPLSVEVQMIPQSETFEHGLFRVTRLEFAREP